VTPASGLLRPGSVVVEPLEVGMPDSTDRNDRTDDPGFDAAVAAALDAVLPVPDELVEEQSDPPRPPLDSGADEERARFSPSAYGA
jgi:hypothetical protein